MSEEDIKADLVRDRGLATRKVADRQLDDAIAADAEPYQLTDKDLRNRKIFKWGLVAGGIGFFIWILYFLFAPLQSTMAYGICRVFLERQVAFPHTVRISQVEEFETSVRIWYAQMTAGGEFRLDQIQCYYKADPVTGSALDRVTMNRREVDHAIIEAFNKALPAVLENPPDLSIPDPLPDTLNDLTIETDKFRKPIFLQ